MKSLITGMVRCLGSGRVMYSRALGDDSAGAMGRRAVHYPLQRHPQTELFFCASGAVEFFWNLNWVRYPADRVLVTLANAPHTERYLRRQTPYRMLCVDVSRVGVGMRVTSYHPARGYATEARRFAFRPAVHDRLLAATAALNDGAGELSPLRFQALMVEALCESLDQLDNPAGGASRYQAGVVERARQYLHEHFRRNLPLSEVAAFVHYSPCHLNTIFRRHTGAPIRQYLEHVRLDEAARLLQSGAASVKQAAFASGFHDALYFSRRFRKRFGKPPSRCMPKTA